MRPQGSKWAGRINDPNSGRKYDSTIAMKGTGSLRVQGCAFGGMFPAARPGSASADDLEQDAKAP